MDCCLSYNTLSSSSFLPKSSSFRVKTPSSSSCRFSFSSCSSGNFALPFNFSVPSNHRKSLLVVVATGGSDSDWTDFELSGQYGDGNSCLNAPLEPRSPAGSALARVLLNDQEYFLLHAESSLKRLDGERRQAVARMNRSSGSDEASLHRKIAELKERECQTAVEDIMYMLICYKFHGIPVHMLPQISQCLSFSRLEISPSKDWQLESIHSFEVLDMIKEHLTALVGWQAYTSVTNEWKTTQVSRLQLCGMYTSSVLYGYLIKAASLRLSLEGLSQVNVDIPVSEMFSFGSKDVVVFGHAMSTQSTSAGDVSHQQENKKKQENLKCYLMGFDPETLKMCAKPKSKEAWRLIERHVEALFADNNGALDANKVISTSYATLKRYVLEAIAFGSFLWEAEEYIESIYELEEN